jgi:hypothetical protein
MKIEKIEPLTKGEKRARLRYIGLGVALVCGLAGAVLLALSDRTILDFLTCGILCALGAWTQHETYKFAERLYGAS